MLYGLRYFDGLLLVEAIVKALGAGDLEFARHGDQTIAIQMELVTLRLTDGQEMRRIGQLLDQDVTRSRRYADDLHIDAVGDIERFAVDLLYGLALITSTATDTATIVLHVRVNDPIATNFLNERLV